ncbi:hypothetical protein VA7868_02629 [Vibrio aerogenes CECT 7868]|uniref:DUF4123 domain-containing protein n=1 Tax=Vibrio aerogenes CECT 7868 TaxID=1216006 RepID=A0A1M5ZFJ6_9VIBR|nr:DUF4123 domain-containing protein [Vibrio aerogenes]SHI22653.1 hypothetical protein VA7868_02629 [Vibrio aerogenes CECT 7868]
MTSPRLRLLWTMSLLFPANPETLGDEVVSELQTLFEVMTASEGKTFYLLYDRYKSDEASEFWDTMKYRDDVQWCELVRGTALQYMAEGSPILMCIADGNPAETLFYWLDENEPAAAGFGLAGVWDGDFDSLKAHWRPWVDGYFPDGTYIMPRWYDPAVFHVWHRILTPAQRLRFFGSHTQIYLPQRDEADNNTLKLAPVEPLTTSASGPDLLPFDDFPLHLTQPQYDELYYPQLLEAFLDDLYTRLTVRDGRTLTREAMVAGYEEGMALAQSLFPSSDLLARRTFAVYRFHLGDGYYRHPEFVRLRKFYPLREATGEFDDRFRGREDELAPYRTAGWPDELTAEASPATNKPSATDNTESQ